jgi:hypothetical protein
MDFPSGITSAGTRNPPEEWDSAGNNQFIEADSDRQDQNVQKILKAVTILRISMYKSYILRRSTFEKFKYENVAPASGKSARVM